MTLEDLRSTLDYAGHPATYVVDQETSDLAEKAVWAHHLSRGWIVLPALGPSGGVLFSGVELLVR